MLQQQEEDGEGRVRKKRKQHVQGNSRFVQLLVRYVW
jgi:hypothetical protein